MAIAAFLFITVPVVVANYFYVELRRGSFPTDVDSIGIPIGGFILVLLATAPITWGFVWLCVRRYPGRVPFTVWNRERPVWSAVWSALVVFAAIIFVIGTPWTEVEYHPLFVAHALADIYFLALLRSAIVAQLRRRGIP